MVSFILDIFNKLISSFDVTTKGGFSARKLSAFAGIIISLFITYKHVDQTTLSTILLIWLGFVSICLGLVTFEQLMKLKNNDTPPTQ